MYLCNASPRPPNSVVHLPVGTKDYKNIQTGVFKIIDNFFYCSSHFQESLVQRRKCLMAVNEN
jgi:hypothetical protein